MIDQMMQQEIYQIAGWTIIHFLWQGACVGALVLLSLIIWRPKSANRRHVILCASLAVLALCPLVTMAWLSVQAFGYENTNFVSAGLEDAESESNTIAIAIQPSFEHQSTLPDEFRPSDPILTNAQPTVEFETNSGSKVSTDWASIVRDWSPWLVLIWGIGVVLLSIRLIVSWKLTQKIRSSGNPLESARPGSTLTNLCSKLRIGREIKLLQSNWIDSPTVIGWIRPVILLPMSAINGLTVEQLTAVIAHELAHIRRHDYLINLMQSVVEVLLFFHPVVWWISSEIRKERENCCDDIAVSVCGSRRDYVEALLQLEQQRSVSNSLAMAATNGSLIQRVSRLVGIPNRERQLGNWYCGLATLAIAGLVLLVVLPAQKTTAQPAVAEVQQDELDTGEESSDEGVQFAILVVDVNGDPISDATLRVSAVEENPTAVEKYDLITDENGVASQLLSNNLVTVRVWAGAKEFAPVFAKWERDFFKSGKKLPSEYTVVMLPAETIGGKIVDESGEPVVGAKVQVAHQSGGLPLPVKGQRYNRWLAYGDGAAVTDANGIWMLENVPPGDDVEVSLTINHPDFVSDENAGGIQSEQSITMKELANRTASIKLQNGAKIFGTVIAARDKKPIKDALVIWGDNPYSQRGSQETKSNEKGEYRFPTMKPGSSTRVTVLAPGFEPQTRVVKIRKDMPATDFSLKPGKKLQIQFVDESGNPIPNVYVSIESWRGCKAMYNNRHPNVVESKIPWHSDSNGMYTWDWAPGDPVAFNFGARKYASRRNVELAAAEKPHEIKLNKEMYLSGTVRDEQGENLESFTVIPMTVLRSSTHERRDDAFVAKDGFFEVDSNREGAGFQVKIEAEGYQTHVTKVYRIGDEFEPLEIIMKAAEFLDYQVTDVDGEPAVGTQVLIAESNERLMLNYHKDLSNTFSRKISTNNKGMFKLEPATNPRTIIVRSEDGYREVADLPENPVNKIKLEPWYEVSAKVQHFGKSKQSAISASPIRFIHDKSLHIQQRHFETANSEDTFVFKKLPRMPFSITFTESRELDPRERRYFIATEPKSDSEEIRCDCKIDGQVELAGELAENVDLAKSKIEFRSKTPSIRIPPELEKFIKNKRLEPDQYDSVSEFFVRSENWDALYPYAACFDKYSILLDEEGQFDLSAMRPGDYEMTVTLNPKSDDRPFLPLGEFKKTINVRKSGSDLGKFSVSTFPIPQPGSKIENLMFKNRATEIPSWLSTSQGKYLLIDFWKPWDDASKQDQQQLAGLASKLAPDKISLLSLHSYNRTKGDRAPKSKLPVQWTEGQVPIDTLRAFRKTVGALTPQHYLLIDAEGKFVFGSNELADINEKISELELLK